MVSLALDQLLESLADGQPHSFQHVVDFVRCHARTPIPSAKRLKVIIEFLNHYGFIHLSSLIDVDNAKISLTDSVRIFLQNIKFLEIEGS